jgi:hypothetical protein
VREREHDPVSSKPETRHVSSRPYPKGKPLKPGQWDGSRIIKATLPELQVILDEQGLSNGDVSRGTRIALSQVSRIFSGKQSMSLAAALRIAGYLGISVERLAALLKVGSKLGTNGKRGKRR